MAIIEISDAWFRIAGHSKAVKEKLPHLWRCFADEIDGHHPMISWDFVGAVNNENMMPGSSSEEGVDPRLWFSVYGDVRIDEHDIGHFTLKNPQ